MTHISLASPREYRDYSAGGTRRATGWEDGLVAAVAIVCLAAAAIMLSRSSLHWFLFPVAACGILTGSYVVAWLRGRLDTFDPLAIVAILMLHTCSIAPILHVALDFRSGLFGYVPDWRPWYGWMGVLNLVGLLGYHLVQSASFKMVRPVRTYRGIRPGSFNALLTLAILASAVAAGVIFFKFNALRQDAYIVPTTHLSWLMMLGDPFPLLLLVGFIRLIAGPKKYPLFVVILVLIGFLAAEFLLLGLRGSRSAMIAPLFIAAALCHYQLRRIKALHVVLAVLMLGVGGYYYGFYKRFGAAGFDAIRDAQYREVLAHKGGLTPIGALLGNLSRAETQAYLLYRVSDKSLGYELRLGKTYLASAMSFIPRALWPTKPTEAFGKVRAGTELQFGPEAYREGRFESSLVYGIAGEAILNFGPLGVPPMYLFFGAAVGWYRRKLLTLPPFDARYYLAPVLTLVAFSAAFGDSDNMMFSFLKNGLLLLVVVYFGSAAQRLLAGKPAIRRRRLRPPVGYDRATVRTHA